ncbi:hypothetical protein [Salinisphaera sp. G21_0]|uniref:hypothetical protein n=1 Tax=Salinisphaera sp. G21_0 TaxID=2821094 RepID=UPI001AD96D8D|nr:hypothetical protein [Salinisphaera sp. G21_0]MBO9483110.1 hypothetical protein [Salinisphaera sp. G21_0]
MLIKTKSPIQPKYKKSGFSAESNHGSQTAEPKRDDFYIVSGNRWNRRFQRMPFDFFKTRFMTILVLDL